MKRLWQRNINTNFILNLLLLFAPTSTKAHEHEDESGFNYIEGSPLGPSQWGNLRLEWAKCKTGMMQSPIDISNETLRIYFRPIYRTNYSPSDAVAKKGSHDIAVHWEGGNAGSITIQGKVYSLQEAHWHSPSEHTLYGRRFDLELHMVHESHAGEIAVVATLYRFGRPDEFLTKLLRNITAIINRNATRVNLGIVDPNEIATNGNLHSLYMGSLTTPPCDEDVVWFIDRNVKSVSRDQVRQLREAVHDGQQGNARPLQPRNGRDIFLYVGII